MDSNSQDHSQGVWNEAQEGNQIANTIELLRSRGLWVRNTGQPCFLAGRGRRMIAESQITAPGHGSGQWVLLLITVVVKW
jgi:hypothetical protein